MTVPPPPYSTQPVMLMGANIHVDFDYPVSQGDGVCVDDFIFEFSDSERLRIAESRER